ncbi:MAG: helix-turn-helix domain-containing protein [Bdellovibrionaceae bacterium]|nr:helix-turn-helix domain-containing protein [Pseudobdellovibrionaceae bacterium]
MGESLPPGMQGNRWIDVKTTAKLLGRSVAAVRALIYRGKLPCRKYLGRIYVDQYELMRAIENSKM